MRNQIAKDVIASANAVVEANTTLEAKYEAMLAILDRLPIGVVLVGRGCKVHETNECAREILSLDDGIQIHRSVLKAVLRSETQQLHDGSVFRLVRYSS